MVLADEAAHSTIWSIESNTFSPRLSTPTRGPVYTDRTLKVWIFSGNTQTKTIWLLLYVHVAVNLKQWKNKKYNIATVYHVSQELENNLQVIHNQVTINQFSYQCEKTNWNTKKKKKKKLKI